MYINEGLAYSPSCKPGAIYPSSSLSKGSQSRLLLCSVDCFHASNRLPNRNWCCLMFPRRKVLQFDCTSSTLSHLEIPRKNILESFPVLPSTPPRHKPLKSRSYVWFPLRIVNVTYQKTHLNKKTVRGQKTNRRCWKITRLNVLDPVPVLGWIYCAYHQSTQYQKPCRPQRWGLHERLEKRGTGSCKNMHELSYQTPAGSVQSL